MNSLSHASGKLFVIHTIGVLNCHLQELCLYLGVDIEFVFCLVSVFLMFYKMNKRKKMLHTML